MTTAQPSAAAAAWLVGLCTLVGAALRLYGLEIQSLWTDELSGWARVTRYPTWSAVLRDALPPDHPPGFHAMLFAWTRLAGDSATLLRLPSALAGIALVPAMYALARRLYGRREGVLAAALTATAWAPVYYSQEARSYSLLLLAIVVSSAGLTDLLRALRGGARPPLAPAAAYVGGAVAAAYLHYFGLLFVCLQAATAGLILLTRPRALGWMAAAWGVILLAYLPWLPRAAIVVAGGPQWITPPPVGALWRLAAFLCNDSARLATVATVLLAGLALVSLRAWRRRGAVVGDGATLVLFAWLLLPPLLVWVRSHLASPVFLSRTLLIVAPAAYVLLAHAIARLAPRRWPTGVLATALMALLVVHLVAVKDYYVRPTKNQFREAAAWLVANDDAQPAVVLASTTGRYFDYYLERLGSPRRVDLTASRPTDRPGVAALLARRAPAQVWVLQTHRPVDAEVLRELASRRPLLGYVKLPNAVVWRFGAAAAG